MSVKAIGHVWDLDLKPTLKFVLIAYVDHADHYGNSIYPSVETMVRKTGLSRRTVQNATKELLDIGLLEYSGKNKKYQTNTYRYTWKGVNLLHPPTDGGESDDMEGVHLTTQRGESPAPKPLITVNNNLKDSPSAEKPPKAKSQNDIRMETLETHFAAIRGCQPIDWKKDSPQRLQKLWRSPLKRILELRCGGDIEKAQVVIERAINKMLKEKLTVATPASIEKVCEDIAANMNRQGAERYYIPEGDELERQRLEFENAPPIKVD